jgi:hypothetical protein
MPIKFEEEDSGPSLKQKAGALAYGAATGLVGGPGELEEFAAYTVPETLGLREKGERDKFAGRETIFPTVKEAQQLLSKVGIQKPSEDVSGYQTTGEILGGFGTSLPRAVRGGVRALVGTPSATSEKYARAAEDLGFKLSPAQVRQDIPVPSKGATSWSAENQTLANRLASGATGKEAKEISPEFIRERLTDLGKEFDKIYKGRDFVIDPQAAQVIEQIAKNEMQLPTNASVSAVKNTANSIIDNFNAMMRKPGAKPGTFAIQGDALQRLRTDLMQAARSTSSRQDAHAIYELVDVIDQSVARNHPEVAAALSELRPLYRNTIILEDLNRTGGISQGNISLERLGNMLGGRKSGLRTGNRADIDQLGEMGRQLRMRARWETEGRAATAGEDVLGKALGTGADIAGTLTGARSRYARGIQRVMPTKPVNPRTLLPEVTAAGTAARPFQGEE